MGFGSAHPGSVRGLAQAWFHSVQPWFETLVGLGWQLNICIGAGLATLTNQGLANHGPPFLEPNAVLMRLAWAANESQFYSSRFGQNRLNRLYQPKARYKNRPDSKLESVRLKIAARLKAHFSARDSMTRLDLARAGHCRSGLGSPDSA